MSAFAPCALIPCYNNRKTVARVSEAVRQHLASVIVVDDGSEPETAAVLDALAFAGRIVLHRRRRNGGKGAAVKDGLRLAARLGFSHALQLDADGQHDLSAVPRFLELARGRPEAAVFAYPEYTGDTPTGRLRGRQVSIFWCRVMTGGSEVMDPLCGFRVYPLPVAAELRVPGNRMDYDPEVAVRLVWSGVPIVNEPVRVRYLTAAEGGVSHFHALWDSLRIGAAFSRLGFEGSRSFLGRRFGLLPGKSRGALKKTKD